MHGSQAWGKPESEGPTKVEQDTITAKTDDNWKKVIEAASRHQNRLVAGDIANLKLHKLLSFLANASDTSEPQEDEAFDGTVLAGNASFLKNKR